MLPPLVTRRESRPPSLFVRYHGAPTERNGGDAGVDYRLHATAGFDKDGNARYSQRTSR